MVGVGSRGVVWFGCRGVVGGGSGGVVGTPSVVNEAYTPSASCQAK